MKQTFFDKYKVFLSGLAGALVLALSGFLSQPVVNWGVVGFAALMATLSYIANAWRGQGVTILGIVGTLAASFVSLQNTGHFTWQQFILYSAVAILAAVAPPPKSLGYEKTPTIQNAKTEGDQIQKIMSLIILLSICCSCTHAQFFKPEKRPTKQMMATFGATGVVTQNVIRPVANIASYAIGGSTSIGLSGAGISWQHQEWNDADQRWKVLYSANVMTWYGTDNQMYYGAAAGALNNMILIGVCTHDGKRYLISVGFGININ